MGTVYTRGDKLWFAYVDIDGVRKFQSSGYRVGEEKAAKKCLEKLEERLAAEKRMGATELGPPTLRRYADKWLAQRPSRIETANDEKSRLTLHVYPVLGDVPLSSLRPRHVRDLVRQLRDKKSERGKPLAPRTIRNIYGVLRDAQVDELLDANPCVLKNEDLPGKDDADPMWRHTAVFAREEIELLISAPENDVPEDRRVLYTALALAGLRFGEAAALRWRHYDPTITPLGRLLVERSFSVKKHAEKSTKTKRVRTVPVHAVLAAALAEWKVSGWQQLIGRTPKPDDLIFPSREGRNRNVNHGLKRLHEDLERLALSASACQMVSRESCSPRTSMPTRIELRWRASGWMRASMPKWKSRS